MENDGIIKIMCKLTHYLSVLFSVIMAANTVMQVTPNMVTFSRAATAASELFALIDRESEIDPFDKSGDKPERIFGTIDLHDVNFNYPSRPDVNVLENFTLSVPAGKVTALVVSSIHRCLLRWLRANQEEGSIWFRKKHNNRVTRAVVYPQCGHHLARWQ